VEPVLVQEVAVEKDEPGGGARPRHDVEERHEQVGLRRSRGVKGKEVASVAHRGGTTRRSRDGRHEEARGGARGSRGTRAHLSAGFTHPAVVVRAHPPRGRARRAPEGSYRERLHRAGITGRRRRAWTAGTTGWIV
jgi:hypothetical protein